MLRIPESRPSQTGKPSTKPAAPPITLPAATPRMVLCDPNKGSPSRNDNPRSTGVLHFSLMKQARSGGVKLTSQSRTRIFTKSIDHTISSEASPKLSRHRETKLLAHGPPKRIEQVWPGQLVVRAI